VPSPDEKPAYVGNPLAGDPIWEASSAFELRIAITTKQVSRAGHPSDLLVAKSRALVRPASTGSGKETAPRSPRSHSTRCERPGPARDAPAWDEKEASRSSLGRVSEVL
jgi:hypothetical protein